MWPKLFAYRRIGRQPCSGNPGPVRIGGCDALDRPGRVRWSGVVEVYVLTSLDGATLRPLVAT